MRLLLLIFLLPSIFVSLAGCMHEESNTIAVEDAWIREAPPNASAMAGYMRIVNNTEQDHSLVAASSNAFKVIEFHRSVEKDGMYKMIRHEKLDIPQKQSLELKPGDFHLMLIVPKKPLQEGDNVSVELNFADQSKVTVEMPVKKAVYK